MDVDICYGMRLTWLGYGVDVVVGGMKCDTCGGGLGVGRFGVRGPIIGTGTRTSVDSFVLHGLDNDTD